MARRPAVSLGKGEPLTRLVSYGCAPSGTGSVRGFLTRHPASAEKAGHPDRPPSGLIRPLPSPPSSRAKGRPRRLSPTHRGLVCRSAPCARPVIANTLARNARSYKMRGTFENPSICKHGRNLLPCLRCLLVHVTWRCRQPSLVSGKKRGTKVLRAPLLR